MVRFKNRYLLCMIDAEYNSSQNVYSITQQDIISVVRASISGNFGDLAAGQLSSSLTVKLWSPALSICVIRSTRENFRTVWGAISLITELRHHPQMGRVRFTVVHVGGTIRACQKSAIEHARKRIVEDLNKGRETQKLESALQSVNKEMDSMEV